MKAGTSLGQGNKWDLHPAQLVPAPAPAWPPMSPHVPGHMGHEPTEGQHPQLTRNNLPQHFFALLAGAIRTLHHTLCLKPFCKH